MNACENSENIMIKKLLSSPPQNTRSAATCKMDSLKSLSNEEDGTGSKLSSYLEQLCGHTEFINTVELDHNYSKPWNWRPDNTYAKPIKSLFINKPQNNCNQSNHNDEILDPLNDGATPKPAYDEEKARKAIEEPWKQIHLLRPDVGELDWDTKVDRKDWTNHQNRIFDKGCRILHNDRLARLSYTGNWNEPVLRRLSIDRSARRLRTLFSTYGWQYTLVRWLHYLWLDLLHHEYLIAYVEILQTLKKKVPALVERLITSASQSTKANSDMLFMMLQSPWDPTSFTLLCHTPRRLPGNPLLLIVPCGSGNSQAPNTRLQRWHSHLSAIGTVMIVNTNKINTSKITVTNSLEHLMASTRAKIAELKSEYIGRNIILIGLNSGAALACQVSLVEPVSAVICLGFPMNTVEEKRGQPDDSILNLSVPTLFVIGQHAATAHINDMEDLRERLRVQTSLVVVGAADDCLRVNKNKRSADGVTQTMVDRCIVDEVADFIGTVLLTPSNKQDNRISNPKQRMKLVERKRKISINDELLPKKHRALSLSSTQSGITLSMNALNRRGKNSNRGSGRNTKWPSELDGRITTPIQRRTPLDDNSLLTRHSIDNIRIINKNISFNQTSNTGESEDSETYNILSEIKVLGGDESNNENSFVGQLTADRLLEMPVIIAQEDSNDGRTVSVVESGVTNRTSQQMQPVKVMVTSGAGLIRDDLSAANDATEIRQSSLRYVPTAKTSTIHIGRASGKNLHQSTSTNKLTDDGAHNLTKCATIYFRDQANTSKSQAQLHKMDLLPRISNHQSSESSLNTSRRRNFQTQIISRPRPPRIRNFPAVKHNRGDISSHGSDH